MAATIHGQCRPAASAPACCEGVDFALSSPAWTPDGQYMVARRLGPYPGPVDYLRNAPLWIYHIDGGSGTELFPGEPGRMWTNAGCSSGRDLRRGPN